MGAAGDSQGQCCAWGLHCLNSVSYGMSSVTQTGSALQEDENKSSAIYEALPNFTTEPLMLKPENLSLHKRYVLPD